MEPTVVPVDLYAFGNRSGPRPPRPGDGVRERDLVPDASGHIGPESPPFPRGASTFADLEQARQLLRGHFHRLAAGTPLPEGLGVVADGRDANARSENPPSHHTIYPTLRMPVARFLELFLGLPWAYEGYNR
jgi:hypothetical protein